MKCPYVGLDPFRETDRPFFFGREREIRIVASNLCQPITIFYGASGAGKTSVLQAGVVPYLREQGASVVYYDDWQSPDLIGNLRVKVADALQRPVSESRLDEGIAASGKQIFLLLDQFEEYLLYHSGHDHAVEFDSVLARIVNRDDVTGNVLLGIRDDALSKLDQRLSIRIPELLGNTLALSLLSPEAGRIAITKPLDMMNAGLSPEKGRFEIEPDLVERIIDEVQHRYVVNSSDATVHKAQALPERRGIETAYLQLVLQRLWNVEIGRGSYRLTSKTFDEIGGASQIIAEHVREVMDRLVDEGEREIAARMLTYLVTPSGMKVAQYTPDLITYGQEPSQRVNDVLSRLSETRSSRILRRLANPERYELFHDVLAPAILGWCAERKLAQARTAARLASARELITAANANLTVDPERSVLLALCATAQLSDSPDLDPGYSAHADASNALFEAVRASRVRVRFTKHQSRLSGLAYDSTGQIVATSSEDGTARVWNAISAEERCVFQPNAGWLYGVAFHPHGTSIAVAAENGCLLVRELSSDRQMEWKLSPLELYSVSFNPAGSKIAAAGQEGRIWLVPIDHSEPDAVLEGHQGSTYAVAFGPDGMTLASCGEDRTIRLWDLRTLKASLLKGHTDAVKALAFSSDGRLLASSGQDGTVRIWAMPSGKPLKTLYSGYHWVTALAFSPGGTRLASGGTNNEITVWDVDRGRPDLTLLGHTDAIRGIAFHPEGLQLASASSDATARIWQVTEQDEFFARAHRRRISDIAFSPDGTLLGTASDDKTAAAWDVNSGQRLMATVEQAAEVSGVAFHPQGNRLTTAGWDRTVRSFDVSSGTEKYVRKEGQHLLALRYSPDWRFLATAGSRHIATISRVRQTRSGLRLQTAAVCEGHQRWVNAVCFSPDSKFLATSSDDKTVRLWDVSSGKCLCVCSGEDVFQGVAFGLIGRTIVLIGASHTGTATVWDVPSGKPRFDLKGHKKRLHCVASSKDCLRIATGSEDRTVKVWDLETRRETATLAGHADEVWRVAFSPDGSSLASAGLDLTVRIWDMATGQDRKILNCSNEYEKHYLDADAWIYRVSAEKTRALAIRHLSRWLTNDECVKYLHLAKCDDIPDLRGGSEEAQISRCLYPVLSHPQSNG